MNRQWKKCTNCGQKGHFHKECTEPKISIGIILFRHNVFTEGRQVQYLLIRRKYTFAYTDYIRGNYDYTDFNEIVQLIKGISPTEREKILAGGDFNQFWNDIWTSSEYITEKFKKDYDVAEFKFTLLTYPGPHGTIKELFDKYPSETTGPTWEFPKGKRDINESNIKCACREFQEETDISPDEYEIRFDFSPISEEFIGNNGIHYKYIYFVAQSRDLNHEPRINEKNKHQVHEIGEIGWFTLDSVIEKITQKDGSTLHSLNSPRFTQLKTLFEKLIERYHK